MTAIATVTSTNAYAILETEFRLLRLSSTVPKYLHKGEIAEYEMARLSTPPSRQLTTLLHKSPAHEQKGQSEILSDP